MKKPMILQFSELMFLIYADRRECWIVGDRVLGPFSINQIYQLARAERATQ